MCVDWLQVVVESGVVPKLVPLLASDENKIVVCDPLPLCDYRIVVTDLCDFVH